ncbi:MAG: hypothetical protein ISS47_03095 [Candidatus Omnitrophica bacterium]|nr:hypothetical protein [Candidatus Omnitrophota bacterium]
MSEVNILVEKKIKKYPEDVQKVIRKAIELARYNQPTSISEQLEGFLREIIKIKK